MRSLWALMSTTDLMEATQNLADREGIPKKNIEAHVGCWSREMDSNHKDDIVSEIGAWASSKRLDAAIWTKLPPQFKKKDRVLSIEQVISFLKGLSFEEWQEAKKYVRNAPIQIDTEYRRELEREFGWSPSKEALRLDADVGPTPY